ncbi:hypothetical protein [Bacillus sp. T33-2]|uniref:hypothetical protein n=1 Tax=Bacillus sp. T33-2 TaxID=2054168 RepID=UPI000C75B6A0|nr:hypothetical protein [Bacillus sp. T33-2]PLR89131.1 hypothetical protein CVD19_23940 [Bacillus sp. T33-2]
MFHQDNKPEADVRPERRQDALAGTDEINNASPNVPQNFVGNGPGSSPDHPNAGMAGAGPDVQ